MNPVSLVVLTWNRLDRTQAFLASLAPTLAQDQVHLVVVDNGSKDGTPAWLREHCLGSLIFNEENQGFTKGVNQALEQIPQHHDVVLLNNDLVLQTPDWLERMRALAYADDKTGLVGCRLTRPDGLFQHGGAVMPLSSLRGVQLGGGQRDMGQFGVTQSVSSVVFACVFIKREVFSAVGTLDEDYFSYYEDTDFCLRARSAGFDIKCCGDVTHLHYENSSTEAQPETFRVMYEQSREVFKRKWEPGLLGELSEPINWRSILHLPTGYAQTCRGLLSALRTKAMDVRYHYAYGPGTDVPFREPDLVEADPLVADALGHADTPTNVEVVYGMANVFHKAQGKTNVGFTMLEVDRFPKDWVDACNTMDEVWVPSAFHKEALQAGGVSRPVYTVPLGIDSAYYNPKRTSFAPANKKDFTFLSVFEWGERKAPQELLTTFNKTFTADEPVVLVVKIYLQDRSIDIFKEIEKLNLSPKGGRIVPVINHLLPYEQMGSFYNSFDAFVFMSRGEGWGMPCMEAMACGLPVIASNFSGTTAFLTPETAHCISPKGMEPAVAKCPYYEGALWASLDTDAFADAMRHVVTYPNEAKAMGKRASAHVLEHFTWNKSAEVVAARLQALGLGVGV